MDTCKCDWCGELFWSDTPDQGMCPTCTEEPVARTNKERAVEQLERIREKANLAR